jgi:hypothetical protein
MFVSIIELGTKPALGKSIRVLERAAIHFAREPLLLRRLFWLLLVILALLIIPLSLHFYISNFYISVETLLILLEQI